MALNPQLFPNGTPVPFMNEMFVLTRDSVEIQVENVPDAPGGKFVAKGALTISNVRIVFVADKPVGNLAAFDLPLLYIHEEKFNQPIFFANNLTGKSHPVVPEGENPSLYGVYNFKILFREGGVGTFVPLFFNLLRTVRGTNSEAVQPAVPPVDPLPSEQAPVDEMIRHAYMDPNDPTKLYLQQPFESQPTLRRRTYKSSVPEEGQL
ncbi:hypothetical protein R1sor_005569 [Riccia sorocarpa]|uniref:Uncharacterized protein n=1 Tax=Riccia sorocarpa TaxID=122646 RepID=A0ABD3HKJ5_9MARC